MSVNSNEKDVRIEIDPMDCQLNIPLPKENNGGFISGFNYFVTEEFYNNHLLKGLTLPLQHYENPENFQMITVSFEHESPLMYEIYDMYINGSVFLDYINELKKKRYSESLTDDEIKVILYSIKPVYKVLEEEHTVSSIVQ